MSVRQNRGKEWLWGEKSEQAVKKIFIRFVKLRQAPFSGFPVFYPAQLKNQLDNKLHKRWEEDRMRNHLFVLTCLSSSWFSSKATIAITLKLWGFKGSHVTSYSCASEEAANFQSSFWSCVKASPEVLCWNITELWFEWRWKCEGQKSVSVSWHMEKVTRLLLV